MDKTDISPRDRVLMERDAAVDSLTDARLSLVAMTAAWMDMLPGMGGLTISRVRTTLECIESVETLIRKLSEIRT